LDATVQVALIGIITTIVTTFGVIIVAVVNNRKERGSAAESAMERTLRERIILRDEQIEDLKVDVAERDQKIAERDQKIMALIDQVAKREEA
jgi:hypothetical protein